MPSQAVSCVQLLEGAIDSCGVFGFGLGPDHGRKTSGLGKS